MKTLMLVEFLNTWKVKRNETIFARIGGKNSHYKQACRHVNLFKISNKSWREQKQVDLSNLYKLCFKALLYQKII